MGGSGTATVDFGAFPGSCYAEFVVTGQTGILSGSLVEATVYPVATADHTADEHLVEGIFACADPSTIVAGTGFTVRVVPVNQIPEPVAVDQRNVRGVADRQTIPVGGGAASMLYGQWTIMWVWN